MSKKKSLKIILLLCTLVLSVFLIFIVFNLKKTQEIPFIEVIYEQGFSDFSREPIPPEPPLSMLPGYIFKKSKNSLYPSGNASLPDQPRTLIGQKLYFRHSLDYRFFLKLFEIEKGNSWEWEVNRSPESPELSMCGVFSLVRLPVTLKLTLNGTELKVKCQDKSLTIDQGKTALVYEGTHSVPLTAYLETISSTVPGIPLLTEEGRDIIKTMLITGKDNAVTVFGRIWINHHDPVRFININPRRLWEEIQESSTRGEFTKTLSLLAKYTSIIPEDAAAREMITRTEKLAEEGVKVFHIHGRISLPSGFEFDESYITVGARAEDGPPDLFLGSSHLKEGAYSLYLPEGEYVINVFCPGYKEETKTVSLSQDTEVNFEISQKNRTS